MFGKSITLFRLLGFEVKVDLSWIVLALLITWTLAAGVFPHYHPELGTTAYWLMGVAGTLGLFASILFHELSHSLVSRRFGLPIKGITLFIFGGVAEMHDEPERPGVEFFMAVAGPVASVVFGGVLFGISLLGAVLAWPASVTGVIEYLWFINFLLAGFNLIPAFPLDGGRVFRSILWKWLGDLRRATRIASAFGAGFGLLLIFLGVASLFYGNLIGGLWWILIGFFIRQASQASYQRVLMRRALRGEPVRRFMRDDPVTVPPSETAEDFVEDYVYRHHYKMFPVTDDGSLRGCVTTRDVKDVPREAWRDRKVEDLVSPCTEENTIGAGEDAMDAFERMNRTGNSRLMVVENDALVGVIALKDIMRFLSLKLDLEGE